MRFQVDYLKARSLKVCSGDIMGSGFVATSTGFVITCFHLIKDQNNVFVENVYGRRWPAHFVRGNSDGDYAILKFGEEKVQGIPPVEFGNYNDLREGDEVIFCGFPYAVSHFSVHRAMISAKLPKMLASGKNIGMFEFDGSCNPGHSGAALMKIADGKVYGIVSAYFGLSPKLKKLEDVFRFKASMGAGQIETYEANGETHKINSNELWADLLNELHLKLNVGIGYAISIDDTVNVLSQEIDKIKQGDTKGATESKVVAGEPA